MYKMSKDGLYEEISNLLVNKFGVDEGDIKVSSILGDDLNLGPAEIEELILDVCEKHSADHDRVIDSLDHDELEEVTVADLVDTFADILKFD